MQLALNVGFSRSSELARSLETRVFNNLRLNCSLGAAFNTAPKEVDCRPNSG